MNKVYKVVWNSALSIWVVASELAKSKVKGLTAKNVDNSQINEQKTGLVKVFTLSGIYHTLLVSGALFIGSQVNAGPGIFINDGTDTQCIWTYDTDGYRTIGNFSSSSAITSQITSGSLPTTTQLGGSASVLCSTTDIATQTTRVLFYGNTGGSGATSLTLGGRLDVNSGVIGVGSRSGTTATNSIRMGTGTTLTTNDVSNGIAIGVNNTIANTSNIALGDNISVAGSSSIAIGSKAKVSSNNALSLGDNATVGSGLNGAVALGSSSVASAAVVTASSTINGKTYTFAGGTPLAGNVVSVGSAGNERQIQNVAAGRISASSTDAINGSQLYSTNQTLETTTSNIARALGTTVNSETGGIVAPVYTVKNTEYDNVKDAISSLNTAVTTPLTFTGDSGSSVNKLGSSLAVIGDSNITTAASQGQIALSLNQDLNLNSVTLGDTVINQAGVTADKVTVGTVKIDSSSNKITGLAAGTEASDAVNVGQLTAVNATATAASDKTDALGESTANHLGGGASYNSDTGALSAPSYTVVTNPNGSTTTVHNVGDAINSLTTAVTTPLTFTGDSGSSVNKLGSTLSVLGDGNITTTASQGQIAVSLNKTLTGLTSISTGNTFIDSNGLSITGGPSITTAGIDAAGKKISNVAAGTANTDAVNVSQLTAASAASDARTDALGTSTASNLGGGASYDATTGEISAPNYSVTTNPNEAGATTTVHNVGDAINSLTTAVTTPLTFTGDSGSSVNKLGSTLSVLGDGNITTTASQGQIAVSLNKTLTGLTSISTGNTFIDSNGLSITGGPSITTAGIDAANSKISNVADGTAASDAINKGQLDTALTAQDSKSDGLGSSTAAALGGGASYDATTGEISAPNYSVTTNPNEAGATTTVHNVGDAINSLTTAVTTPLTFTGDSGSSVNKLGSTLSVLGDGNITTTASQGQIAVSLNKTLTGLTSISTGNTFIDSNGLSITGGPSITTAGIDAAGKKISNVADGTAASDAINKGQLDTALTAQDSKSDGLGSSTAAALGGGASYDATTGEISAPNYSVTTNPNEAGATTTVHNVGDAINSLTTAVTTPLTFTGDSGSSVNKLGSTLSVLGDGNITTTASQGQIAVSLNKTLTGLTSISTGNTFIDSNGLSITGGPSITTAGIDAAGKKISNVADGTAASDAINKGQLDTALTAQDSKSDGLGSSTAAALGGGASYDATTGEISAPNYSVTTNPNEAGATTTVHNVGDAINSLTTAVTTPLTFTGDSGSSVNKLGSTLSVLGDGNITTTASQGQIAVSLNKTLTGLTSISTGNTFIDSNGLSITGGPSITTAGIDAAGKKISNVADGTAASDAINKGQLDTALTAQDSKSDGLGSSTAAALGGGASYDATTGEISAPNYSVTTNPNEAGATTTVHNVGDAINSLTTAVTTPLTFTGDSGSSVNKLGSTLSVLGDGNITTTASQGQIAVSLNKTLTGLTSISTGNTFIDSNGLSITGGPSITTAGIDAAGKKISNVADGTAASDAINKGQLDTALTAQDSKSDGLGSSTAAALGGGASYDATTGEISAPNYSVTTNPNEAGATTTVHNVGDAINSLTTAVTTPLTFTGDSGSSVNKLGSTLSVLGDGNITTTASQGQIAVSLNKTLTGLTSISTGNTFIDSNGLSITGGPSITTAGIDAAGKKISNVADGTANTDAVNVSQLTAASAASDARTDALGTSTASNLGGGASYDATTGEISAPNYSVTTNPNEAGATTTVHNVGDAINSLTTAVTTPLTFTGDSGSSVNKLGSTLSVLGDGNITTTASQGQIAVSLNKTLTGLTSISTGNTFIDSNGLSITGGPSITTAGIDAAGKKISNVADGTAASDAINKGQLDTALTAQDSKSDGLGSSTAAALGGGASYDATTGEISAPNYSVTTNPNEAGATTTVHNVGDAINSLTTAVTTPLTFTGDSGSSINKLGSTLSVLGDGNITTTASQGQIAVSLNKTLTGLTSISTGNTFIDSNGLSITGGPGITTAGIDAANSKISNVADGTAASDAINKGQLDTALTAQDSKSDGLGSSTAAALGGGASYDATTGEISAPNYSVTTNPNEAGATTTVHNVGDAINSLTTAVTTPLTFTGDSGSSVNKLGSTLSVLGDGNITTTASQGQIAVSLNKTLTGLTSISTGNTFIDSNGLSITGGPSITTAGIDAAGKKISNVADGTAASDAINKGQLDTALTAQDSKSDGLGSSTAAALGGGASYDATTGEISAPNYSVTTNPNEAGATTTVHNVGDAINSLTTAVTTPLTFTGDSGSSINKLGSTLSVLGDGNITTTASQGQIAVSLNKTLTGLTSISTGNTFIDSNGLSITGGPSITTAGIDAAGKKISNVADGTANTDAVNVSQLTAASAASDARTDALGTSTASNLGGGASYDATTGEISAPNYSVTTNPNEAGATTTVHNVGDAINSLTTAVTTPLTFTGDSGSSINKLGSTLSVLGDGNITTTASQGQIAVSLNKTLTGLTSISTGNTFIDSNGLSITGGPSITTAGIDAAGKKISNVADGTANTDAVNVSQLTAASAASDARTDALGTSTASNLGGGASYDATTGEISAPNYSVTTNPNEAGATTTVHNVGDAINSLTTAVTTPLTFTGDSGSSINKLGSTLSVLGDGNITTTASQGQIAVSLNKTLTGLTSISTGNTFIDSNGLSITGGPSITTAGIDAANSKISNVADGTASSDAINKGQLDTALTAQDSKSDGLGSSTAAALGGGASYDTTTGEISAPNYSVTTNPNEAGATTTVHNVGDAINSLTTAVTTPLTFTGDSGSSVNKLGSTLSVLGDGNITTTASQGQIAVSLNKTLTGLTSISTGNTFINSNGLSITGGPSITTAGIDAAGKKISNVADGTASSDAINKGQLDTALTAQDSKSDGLGSSTAAALGGGASYDTTTGEISAPNYSVTTNPNEAGATTTVHNVGDAINSLTTAVTTPLTFTGDSGSSVNPLGSSLAMLGDSNITTAMTQGQLAIKLNKDLKDLSSIETTDGKGNSNLMSSVGNTVTDNQNTTIYGANGIDINNGTVTLSNNGLSITNGPSITVSGINAGNKVISNVAAGVAATDAVNKAQLDSIVKGQDAKTDILGNATASALGGGASYDSTTGSISAPGYQVTINPADASTTTTVNNVADAINSLNTAVMKPLTFIGDNGTSINQLGSTLAFIGDNNIITEVMQGQIQVKLNKDLKGMSSVQIIDENDPAKIATLTANGTEVTDGKNTAIYGSNGVNINNGAVTLSNNGLIIANGPSITVSGINAGNKVISNVANGVAATDAVNVGQLDSAVNSLNQAIKDLNSNAVQYDDITDNTANTHSVTLAGNNGTTIHNLADGEVVSGSKDAVNGGQLADVRDNLQNQITQNTHDINNIKNDINNGTVGLVQQAGGKDAEITVAKDTGGTKVNVGGTSGDRIVTGVANGAVTDKSKDAVNGSQLNTTNQAIITYLGGGAVYDTNTQNFTAPSYSVGDSVHHNVGDAINALNQEDQNLNSKIDNLGNQLQEVFQSTNKRINDVEKRANAGIAAALSLEAAPFVPGKYTYAAGTAYHGGESAVGITLRKTADNGRWSITSGIAAASQGEPSFRIGVSGVID